MSTLLVSRIDRAADIAYGIDCMWWDRVGRAKITSLPTGLYHVQCPYCGGLCNLHGSEQDMLDMARRFETLGFAGHRSLIQWLRGKCYKTRGEAWSAFTSAAAQ